MYPASESSGSIADTVVHIQGNDDESNVTIDSDSKDDDYASYFLNKMSDPPIQGFESIQGMSAVKRALCISLMQIQGSSYKYLLPAQSSSSHVLFYGPPGTGKSVMARAFAGEAKPCKFFEINPSDILSRWLGDGEKKLQSLFRIAQEVEPSIILFDEIDAMFGHRNNDNFCNLITEFLLGMDKLRNVIILGSSNFPYNLDPAILRRFSLVLPVGYPKFHCRLNILKKCFQMSFSDEECRILAQESKGFSCSDIKRAISYAQSLPLLKTMRSSFYVRKDESNKIYLTPCSSTEDGALQCKFEHLPKENIILPSLTMTDVREGLRTCKPSLDMKDSSNEYVKKLDGFTKKFGHKFEKPTKSDLEISSLKSPEQCPSCIIL